MKLVALAAALTSLGLARTAHADCGTPHWIGTPSGTTIPEHGSLYIYIYVSDYDDDGMFDAVFSDGVPHSWKRTRISDDVVRLDYAAGLASSVRTAGHWYEATYPIDPQWKAPTAAPRVIQYWHHVSEWTCSMSDSWMIQVDQPTAAFRIRWTHAGNTREFIEPAQPGDDGRSVLEIGKHDCIGAPSIALDELAAGGTLELFAIRFDGSEVAVTGLPRTLRTSDMRSSDGGVADAIGYASAPPVVIAPPVVTNAGSGHAFLVIAGGGVGLLFIGMLLAGRKRTPTPVEM